MAHNTNRQGANFELEVMHYLAGCDCETNHLRPKHVGWRGFGYDCLRSSGSRGKVDVVAVGPPQTQEQRDMAGRWLNLLFIQCKITNPLISPAERMGLRFLSVRAEALPLVAYRAKDITTGRMRPHFRELTGHGPKDFVLWEPGEAN